MKNELLDTSTPETGSLLIDVLNLSSRLALGVFDKEQFTPDSYVQLLESMHLSVRSCILFGMLHAAFLMMVSLSAVEAQTRICVRCTV